jgi:hypothetical protein
MHLALPCAPLGGGREEHAILDLVAPPRLLSTALKTRITSTPFPANFRGHVAFARLISRAASASSLATPRSVTACHLTAPGISPMTSCSFRDLPQAVSCLLQGTRHPSEGHLVVHIDLG